MDHPNAFFKTIKYLIHHLKNINFLIWKCQNETQQNTKIIIIKKLVWYLNIKSVNQSKKIILDTTVSIGKEKNIKVEPIDLPFKNKVMLYCDKLPFVILSPNFYLDIEKMNNFLITMIMFIIIFFEIVWKDHYAETSNSDLLHDYSSAAKKDLCLIHEKDKIIIKTYYFLPFPPHIYIPLKVFLANIFSYLNNRF